MKCSIQGCPGEYEEKTIIHTLRKGSEVLVFERVPAEVCSVCGDTLLKPETDPAVGTAAAGGQPTG